METVLRTAGAWSLVESEEGELGLKWYEEGAGGVLIWDPDLDELMRLLISSVGIKSETKRKA